ncbi:PAS domain-containing protein, partial [Limosilactobacillus fermentum]
MLADFHSGKEDHAEFWINLHGERFIHIEYYALHDDQGQYLGCLEVSQD